MMTTTQSVEKINNKNVSVDKVLNNLKMSIASDGLKKYEQIIPQYAKLEEKKNKEILTHLADNNKQLGKVQKDIYTIHNIAIEPYETAMAA